VVSRNTRWMELGCAQQSASDLLDIVCVEYMQEMPQSGSTGADIPRNTELTWLVDFDFKIFSSVHRVSSLVIRKEPEES